MTAYHDDSYPPVGPVLQYRRGDGALVTLHIEDAGTQHVPVPVTAVEATQPQPAIIQLTGTAGAMTGFICLRAETNPGQQQLCLESFIASTTPEQLELRVVLLGANPGIKKLVRAKIEAGQVAQAYEFSSGTDKFAAMRRVWHDAACRITSPWVLWADDSVLADVDPYWCSKALELITTNKQKHNAHLFGAKYGQLLTPAFRDWITGTTWYKRKPFRNRNGAPDRAGNFTYFVRGHCFIVSHEAIAAADLPDPAANQNYGAVILGEQVYQAGFNMRQFNADGQFLRSTEKTPMAGSWPVPGAQHYLPGKCGDWYRYVEQGPPLPVQPAAVPAPVEPPTVGGKIKKLGNWTVLELPALLTK